MNDHKEAAIILFVGLAGFIIVTSLMTLIASGQL